MSQDAYELATLALIQRVYAPPAQREFHRHSLDLVMESLDAEGGVVVVQTAGGGHKIALGQPVDLSFRHAAVLRRSAQWFTDEAPPAPVCGEDFGLALRCVQPIRARHQGAGSTLWLLARGTPFTPVEQRRAQVLGEHLGFAGELALNARPRMSTPGERAAGLFAQATPGAALDVSAQLDALPIDVSDAIRWAARGYTNAEIAANLAVSEATVARYLNRGYHAFGVAGRHELDVKAILAQPKPRPRTP